MITSLGNLDILSTSKKGGETSPVTPDSLPGILPKLAKGGIDPLKLRVRYQKLNLDEPGDIAELERIETKTIRNQGVYVMSKKDFVFMDKIFILIQYMEEIE